MAKLGPTPSLIGGGAGTSRFVRALKKRTCKRCNSPIAAGTVCIEVAKPGTMGHRTYCHDCYEEVLDKSQDDLEGLRKRLRKLK